MINLLIVEDEPLIQIGLRSMLNWAEYGISICGTAKDGIQGLEMIEKYNPSIVITDIKMPRMDGIELMKLSRERFGRLPVFIVLTSYEDFHLLRESMKYGVVEYLVKIELNQESLIEVVKKGLLAIAELEGMGNTSTTETFQNHAYYDKFFIRLLLNLFENEKQEELQANELNLQFQSYSYVVTHSEIVEYSPMWETSDKAGLLKLYSSTVQMIREALNKFLPCYVASLDTKRFSVIFCLDEAQTKDYKELIMDIMEKTHLAVHNYFNVSILTGIGRPRYHTLHISEGYQDARQIFSSVTREQPILFYEDTDNAFTSRNIFNLSLFREDIIKAFEEFDTDNLCNIFAQIEELFLHQQNRYLQCVDAASNILYLAISLLPEGEENVYNIFQGEADGYRSLYKLNTVPQVLNWLNTLRDGLCLVLTEQRKNYRNHIVANVKKYIDSHVDEKLTLNDVSAVFGLSPNYLSQLFKKYNDLGFTDYITHKKIAKAKLLMSENNIKLYEIADRLGFENSFYFSKVFKKVEGCSPREYLQKNIKLS